MNSTRSKIAVFGGGHLGTIHARLVQQVPNAELVAIVEPSAKRAEQLKSDFDCNIVTDVEQFVDEADFDGAVVAAPTSLHHRIGLSLLDRGVHCLIEKPLASSPVECEALVTAARRAQCVLQVGHVERFNPAWTTFCERASDVRFIKACREGTLTFRSMDGGVVLDLMIHDIDLILSLVKSPVVSVEASGFHWTGPAEDIAHAQLTFANGCVAQLSASRVSSQPQRQMQVYGSDWSGVIDFGDRSCQLIYGPHKPGWQTRSYTPADRKHLMENLYTEVLAKQDLQIPDGNPILDELQDFVTSIQTQSTPIVSGFDGLRAVEIAHQVIQQVSHGGTTARTYRRAG